MGYYSNVAFAIEGKIEDVIPVLTTYRTTYEPASEAINALNSCRYVVNGEHVTVVFHDESMKWYLSYPDVEALTALYDAFAETKDDEEKFAGAFLRTGEDPADIEDRYFGEDGYDLISLEQNVLINVDHSEFDTLEKLCATTSIPPTSSQS